MNAKTVQRVDLIYRSAKQLPLLSFLTFFIPVLYPFILPVTLIYLRKCSKLKKELESGLLVIENQDKESYGGGPSNEEKLDFLCSGRWSKIPFALGIFFFFMSSVVAFLIFLLAIGVLSDPPSSYTLTLLELIRWC